MGQNLDLIRYPNCLRWRCHRALLNKRLKFGIVPTKFLEFMGPGQRDQQQYASLSRVKVVRRDIPAILQANTPRRHAA